MEKNGLGHPVLQKLFSQRKGVNGSILTYYQMKKLIETAAGHWYMSLVSVMQQKMYLEFFRYFSGINVGLAWFESNFKQTSRSLKSDVRLFEAKNWVFELNYQKMNMFECSRRRCLSLFNEFFGKSYEDSIRFDVQCPFV